MGDGQGEGDQFHFHPESYLAMVEAEVPSYHQLQREVVAATRGMAITAALDLGTGTGETAAAVLAAHPSAALVGIDESEPMLAYARQRLPGADLRVQRLEDPLPEGRYDVVVSGLAVHHLDGPGKADLFRRVADRLGAGGRFVLADVVVPDDPADAITPVDGVYDRPSRLDEQLEWLRDAGFMPTVTWQAHDLAVIAADYVSGT